jgi:hypothetical protein
MTCTSTGASMTHAHLKQPNATVPPSIALAAINRACSTYGIADSAFGRRSVGDPRLVYDLRRGAGIRHSRFARVQAFIASLGEA